MHEDLYRRTAVGVCALLLALAPSIVWAQASRVGASFGIMGGDRADVAFDSTQKVYFVIAGNYSLSGTFLNEHGTILAGPFPIAAGGTQQAARVAYSADAGAFLVTWLDFRTNDLSAVYGRMVKFTRDTNAVSFPTAEFSIDTGGFDVNGQMGAAVAYASGSQEFLVAWHQVRFDGAQFDIRARRISYTGAPIGDEFPVTADAHWQAEPNVAYNPARDEFLVVWGDSRRHATLNRDYDTARGVRVKAGTGAILDGSPAIFGGDIYVTVPVAQYDPATGGYLVAWYQNTTGAVHYGQRINHDLSPVGGVFPITLGYGSYDGFDVKRNPVSGTLLATFHGHGPEDMAVELSATYTPGGVFEATASGGTGNFYPRLTTRSDVGEWLLVTARDHATVMGQRVGTPATGGGGETGPTPCTITINPSSISIAAVAADGDLFITTDAGCEWSASSSSGFISFENASGRTGSGTLPFAVAANDSGAPRTGTATIGGQTFTVNQAAPCTYSINPVSVSLSSIADSGTIFVTTESGCGWSATSHASFITFENASNRLGSGQLPFSVAGNTETLSRSGTATIAGITFSVTQAPGCTYEINPANVSLGNVGDSGTVFVSTGEGCPWSAQSEASFLYFSNGSGRSGPGTVDFNVATNAAALSRSGHGAIAGLTFTVTQAPAAVDPHVKVRGNRRADFTGDGNNDLLWHDLSTGALAVWALDGPSVAATLPLSHSVLDNTWRIVGSGDFNGDEKPDIVWQHATEGWVYLWYMDGTARIGHTYFSLPRAASQGWQVVGVGDMTGDGQSDLVWQHPTERWLALWEIAPGGIEVTERSLSPNRVADADWRIAGLGDFDADGKLDLLWRHQISGEMAIWLMDDLVGGALSPTRIVALSVRPGAVADKNWRIAGVLDVNGDNIADIVWHHTTEAWVATWYMNVDTRVDVKSFNAIQPLSWMVVGPKEHKSGRRASCAAPFHRFCNPPTAL